MTTSRIVRGTKARIFIYICAILIITGVIACYNNTLSQLDDARKSSEICHQQEENLSTQLQVISDYKQRLEKSLKTEKAEHQQSKTELENKLNEEKVKNEKSGNEMNLRFSSLKQHYNLLQTQHNDFRENCSIIQKKQLNEINDLESRFKEVQEELKKIENLKENLRTQVQQLQSEKENLQKQLNNYLTNHGDDQSQISYLTRTNQELQKEVDSLKEKCQAPEALQPPNQIPESAGPQHNSSFNAQLQIGPNEYKINSENNKLAIPQNEEQKPNNNFIRMPTRSTTSSSLNISQPVLNGARPLLIPTVTPESVKKVKSSFDQARDGPEMLVLPPPFGKKLPDGVVPVPENHEDKKTDDNELPQESQQINDRYHNKIERADDADRENVANEVFDSPVGRNAAYDGLGFGDLNEAGKNVEKQNVHKQADNLVINDYKDNHDMQLEENDPEDDDADEYGDHLVKLKDPIVRN